MMRVMYEQQPTIENEAPLPQEQAPEAKAEAERPAVAAVRAMIDRHEASAEAIARIMTDNIYDRSAILQVLHQTLGNAFVEQVMDAVANQEYVEAPAEVMPSGRGPGAEAVWSALGMDMAAEDIATLMMRYPNEWDEMRALVVQYGGDSKLTEVMAAYDASQAQTKEWLEAANPEPGEPATAPPEEEAAAIPEPAAPLEKAAEAVQAAPEPVVAPKPEAVETRSETDTEAPKENPVVAQVAEVVEGPADTAEAAGPTATPEPEWVATARAYNDAHQGESQAFLEATGGACLDANGQVDPQAVKAWQQEHGVHADGKVGPKTAAAAQKAPAPAAEVAPEPGTAGPASQVQELLVQVSSWGPIPSTISCSDTEFPERLSGYTMMVDLYVYFHASYVKLREQMQAIGQGNAAELEQLSDAIGIVERFVTVQTESVNQTFHWTSFASVYAEVMQAYELARAVTPTPEPEPAAA
jgi:hypothetical protein